MDAAHPAGLERFFRAILRARWWIVAIYALALPPSIWFALHVEQDDAIERLIVESDPHYLTAKEFAKVFGEGEFVLLLAESDDPFAPDALRRVDEIERAVGRLGKVEASSLVSVYRRAHPDLALTPESALALRAFARGTELFRRQGLVGDRFLAIPLGLDVRSPGERNQVLEAIDRALEPFEGASAPLAGIRKVGGPYVNRYLESATSNAVARYFPLFAVFLVALNVALYRSFRALAAFLLATFASVALTVGYVGATGGVLTIVSSLVPMTVLITCTATLVYIHSRYVEQPEGATLEDHQVFALANKFLPCTASVFATLVGFAALAVSKIRPIRELGIWTAVGLGIVWIVAFTLFPALQRILRTPTQAERRVAGHGHFRRLTDGLPLFTYRWRWPLVVASLALCAVGTVAIFGLPGVLEPMRLETDALEYIDPPSRVYKDTKAFESAIAGLSVTEVWLRGEPGSVTDPEVLRGIDLFARLTESDDRVGVVVGPTTVLRAMRYVGGEGDELPEDPQGLERLAGDLESLLPSEPALQQFVEKATLSQARLSVIARGGFRDVAEIERFVRDRWAAAVEREDALASFQLLVTGPGLLEARIAEHLVPTLVESFGITVAIIFVTFLFLFRNGAARLMAMIPSLFAILVMFLFMRTSGIALNVATILIATTVLGASENDQIHFFYHFLEKRRSGSTEEGLRHTLFVAGRAIVFATLINAGGFLALALSDLPPMRHFGVLTALAFLLSMIADFTALPAALWIVFRESPSPGPRPGTESERGAG